MQEKITISYVGRTDNYERMTSLHWHTRDELIVVESGVSTILTPDGIRKQAGAFVIFFPHGYAHQQLNDDSFDYCRWCIKYAPSVLDVIMPADRSPRSFFVLPLTEPELNRIRPLLVRMMDDSAPEFCEDRRKYLLALLLCELTPIVRAFHPMQRAAEQANNSILNNICLYLNEHYAEQLRLVDIAQEFYISRAKLVRLFSTILGMTVVEYLNAGRIEKSKALLRQGVTLSEAAARCGFTTVSYFTQCFRRLTGITPAKYRGAGRK